MSISHFIYGLLGIGVGILLLKYNFQVVGFTGRQEWIESKVGSGSTYLAYKLFALLIIAFGFMYATGLADPFFHALFAPLRGFFPQQ